MREIDAINTNLTIRAEPGECPFWTILSLILQLFRVNRDDSRKNIVNMIQLVPLSGLTHDIFPLPPSALLNYFRLPSIYTSLYIDIHIEYTYINYVTSRAPSRRTTYILFAPPSPPPPPPPPPILSLLRNHVARVTHARIAFTSDPSNLSSRAKMQSHSTQKNST